MERRLTVRGGRLLERAAALALALAPAVPAPGGSPDPPYVVVLGIAQDGGAPQAGCRGECCADRFAGEAPALRVACLGIVDPATGRRWMIDATPDFRWQLRRLDELAPPSSAPAPALDGILLTHGHTGHYTGLADLGREAMGARGTPVYAMPRMAVFLESNGPWDQLVRLGNIEIRPLAAGTKVPLAPGLSVTPIAVPHRDEYTETVGFRIDGPSRSALYVPDIDKWDRWETGLAETLAGVDVAWLDGTFYDAGELGGRDMSRIPHPFVVETMASLGDLPADQRAKVRFIHLNHTNPALRAGSAARRAVEAAGFHVAGENERFDLATAEPNPPAPGFDAAGSDARAIEIADAVMRAMGGRRAWDETRYLTWRFAGRRTHVWDKHAGRCRIEGLGPRSGKPYVMLIDLNTGRGRAWSGGDQVTEPGELEGMLASGMSAWINDSYWLLMPYKLKDSGVTLRDLGEGETADGRSADVLELTFTDVGETPQNKYHVWVARESGLVEQWAFFENAADAEPGFVSPWRGWTRSGGIMLSGDRGRLGGKPFVLTGIAVFDELPDEVFESPRPWSPTE